MDSTVRTDPRPRSATANVSLTEWPTLLNRMLEDLGREGYDNAREYVSKGMDYAGEVSDGMADFVQRQPWLALAGAFVIGYVAAKALRQISL